MNQYSILHVEDDDNDFFFVQNAAKTIGLKHRILRVRDGQEAIDYLSGVGEFADRDEFPVPSLILLDMKMPRVQGMEVLSWIRGNATLQTMIVIILSSSPVTGDVDTAYELGANSFVVKPTGIEQFEHMIRLVRDYWLDISELPSIGHDPHGTGKTKIHRFPNLER